MIRSIMKNIDTVLVDLSGTLHIENRAIPGAIDALCRLRKSGVKVKFVTNTTKEPLRVLHERLIALGFDIKKDEIFTSLTAARNLIIARHLRPFLMVEDIAKEDFEGIDEVNPNAVAIGLSPNSFCYNHMNKAFRLLIDGASLIAIHKGRYYKTQEGLSLGPGPFVAGLEYAASTTAEVIGKPEKTFFDEALRTLQSEASRSVMIGDDVQDDIHGAMNAGLFGILVKTGKYLSGDENTISPTPSAVCDDFPTAVNILLQQLETL